MYKYFYNETWRAGVFPLLASKVCWSLLFTMVAWWPFLIRMFTPSPSMLFTSVWINWSWIWTGAAAVAVAGPADEAVAEEVAGGTLIVSVGFPVSFPGINNRNVSWLATTSRLPFNICVVGCAWWLLCDCWLCDRAVALAVGIVKACEERRNKSSLVIISTGRGAAFPFVPQRAANPHEQWRKLPGLTTIIDEKWLP